MKLENEYQELYGNIPRGNTERLFQFLEHHNLSRQKKSFFDEVKRITNIQWKKIQFTIYLLPKATPRPRSTSAGSFFYVKGAKDNKAFFRKQMSKLDLPMIYTPCKFECISYLPIPKSMNVIDQILSEYGFIRPIIKPDYDNLIKTYSDMITGTLLVDDSVIVDGYSSKYYSWKPRIEITLEYMVDFDSKFNYKKIFERKEKS